MSLDPSGSHEEPVEEPAVPVLADPGTPDAEAIPEEQTEGARHARKKEGGSFWKELPVLVLLAFALALLIKSFLIQAFFIPSESMVPTLNVGDRVLVNKVVYHLHDPGRGDVIVFENPHPVADESTNPVTGFLRWLGRGLGFSQGAEEDFIKRIIGLPGETISGRNGSVFIEPADGGPEVRLDEPYLPDGTKTGTFGPVEIPEGEYFVMGDNRGNSNDSRFSLGTIPEDKIVGEAFVIIWPPADWGRL